MTSMIGFYFVMMVLVMVPAALLGAGKDTTRKKAEKRERQQEVLLDWTDKAAVRGDKPLRVPSAKSSFPSRIPVEIIQPDRELADNPAA